MSFRGVVAASDETPADALEIAEAERAEELRLSSGLLTYESAHVQHEGGLVLVRRPASQDEPGVSAGHYFRSLSCGYDDEATRATAEILSLYGFGPYDKLLGELKEGGDESHFHLRRVGRGSDIEVHVVNQNRHMVALFKSSGKGWS